MTSIRSDSLLALIAVVALALFGAARGSEEGPRFVVTYGPQMGQSPVDGRVLLLLSTDKSEEPRFQVSDISLESQQVFGIEVNGWKAGEQAVFPSDVLGYPLESLADLPAGTYQVQALLNRYETFHLANGHTVKLPPDRGEGQQWNKKPGNLYSTLREVTLDPKKRETITILLDQVIPPIPDPPTTKYVKHEKILSERLSKFWGRPVYLGAHVLLPEGFETHPNARYPLVINHGHFPDTIGGFREEPPDPNLKPDYSDRFRISGYNRIQQEYGYQLYKDWTAPGYPRYLVVEIQHANPYFDDSYAVNSANLGPYGDAITYELIPYLEKKYRAIGAGWARFLYGGSTGGWEALGAQIFYPEEFNGAWAACPDPIDFHQYGVVNIYEDENAYFWKGPWKSVATPGHRDYLGHISSTVEQMNRLENVLGPKTRSGGQYDIWQAVYSPAGSDGYPKPIWDKRTGVIDKEVAAYWRDNYDLVHILRRDWSAGLGSKLQGKIHIYVGEADSYYLNNAVYLAEEFLRSTKDPHYGGEVDYEPRAEHCWNGDHTRPNYASRLRYHQMFAPKIVERISKSAPPGADLTSWRY
ncbi:MAG TPA: alpha/beta hydrolase-fold protein [Thermoanaerobaculia bacterium]|nr:alpha/beta hydrolase-fold protein [Thermoanaerobaculia bacterium]